MGDNSESLLIDASRLGTRASLVVSTSPTRISTILSRTVAIESTHCDVRVCVCMMCRSRTSHIDIAYRRIIAVVYRIDRDKLAVTSALYARYRHMRYTRVTTTTSSSSTHEWSTHDRTPSAHTPYHTHLPLALARSHAVSPSHARVRACVHAFIVIRCFSAARDDDDDDDDD